MRTPAFSAFLLQVILLIAGCTSAPIRSNPSHGGASTRHSDWSGRTPGNELNRISATPRSDGMGYVVRLEFDAPVDGFNLVQSSPDLVQVIIYDTDATFSRGVGSNPRAPLQRIDIEPIAQGLGLDLRLQSGSSLRATIYGDRGSDDILVSLQTVERERLELLTDGVPRLDWSTMQGVLADVRRASGPGEGAAARPSPAESDGEYLELRDNMRFDVVVLDAGHGGIDPGSIGVGGIREKDINLNVTLKVGAYLEQYVPELKVVYTRDDDTFVELHERGSIANRAQGDLFVSIHCNSFTTSRSNGAEFYFLGLARTQSALDVMKTENSVIRFEPPGAKAELSEEEILIYELANAGNLLISQQVAEGLNSQFTERARRPSRGVKQAGFVVLFHASMPAILVELGFISNPAEARYLNSEYGQDILASAIFRAIRDYKLERDAAFEAEAGLTTSAGATP